MSISKEALQHIAEVANIPAIIEQVDTTATPLAIVPQEFKITDLEKYMVNRSGFRAKMGSNYISEFVRYSKKYDAEGVKCFINEHHMSSEIIFDVGTLEDPLHGNHSAFLQIKKTAPFDALLKINGEAMQQKKLADWIEDYGNFIEIFASTGESMSPVLAASSIRNMTVETIRKVESEVQDFGQKLGVMDAINVKADGLTPAVIKFNCVPYFGLKERVFEMRISANTGYDTPVLTASIKQFEVIQEEMAIEFKEILEGEFKETNIETFIGSFSI